MTKTISLLTLFFIFGCLSVNSQPIDNWWDEMLKTAPFIFEGEVIQQEPFSPDSVSSGKESMGGTNINFSNIIKIVKILRGGDKLNIGTVEVITAGYSGIIMPVVSDGPGDQYYRINSKGIFFCKPLGDYAHLNKSTDNSLKIMPCEPRNSWANIYFIPNELFESHGKRYTAKQLLELNKKGKLPATKTIHVTGARGLQRTFETLEDLYNFLIRYDNLNLGTIEYWQNYNLEKKE